MSVKVGCIINGGRKRSSIVNETLNRLTGSSQFDVVVRITERQSHAIEIAKELAEQCEILIAIGGDGTCNEVINGIMQTDRRPSFSIIPDGTGNDFHRMLGKFDIETFLESLRANKYRTIDLCKVSSIGADKYALNIAGAGFDAYVVNLLNRQREKGMSGKFSYAWSIIRAFLAYRKPVVEIESDEMQYRGKMLMIVVCNGKIFGHGLTINPYADLENGKLNVTLLGKVTLFDYVRKLSDLKKGRAIQHEKIHYFESERITISKATDELFVEADGECFGKAPVTFSIAPKALNFLICKYPDL